MSRVFQALQKYQGGAATPATNPQVQVILPAEYGESDPEGQAESGSAGGGSLLAVRMLPFCAPDNGRSVAFPAPSSEAAEQYRILRTRILQHPKNPQFVLIS